MSSVPAARIPVKVRGITAAANRGLLLDLTVFALNLLVMRQLARIFVSILRRASGEDAGAQRFLGVYFLLMLVLPAAGAVLKRWHFHRRRGAHAGDVLEAWGCLLNPVFFLAVSLVISTTAGVLFASQLFGEDFDRRPGIFLSLIFGVIVFSIAQTVLVFRFFSPPKRAPRAEFWRGPRGEALGDACIFLNMVLFQVLWNVLLSGRFGPPHGLGDVAGRLFLLWFLSVLVYFPPRVFYLAEDAGRPRSWATIALAVSPVVLHVVLGVI